MSVAMDFLSSLWAQRATEFAHGWIPKGGAPLAVDDVYVQLRLQRPWLPFVRRGLQYFHPVIYSRVSVAHQTEGEVTVQRITLPKDLQQQDAKHFDRLILDDLELSPLLPYRGGKLAVEIGLFSVEARNYTSVALGLLNGVSSLVGPALGPAAQPAATLISNGLKGLADANKQSLEIGFVGNIDPIAGDFLVSRMSANTLDLSKVTLYSLKSAPETYPQLTKVPYFVLQVVAEPSRPNFSAVESLRRAYSDVIAQLANGTTQSATDAVRAFSRACYLSPEVLPKDAKRFVEALGNLVAQLPARTPTGKIEKATVPLPKSFEEFVDVATPAVKREAKRESPHSDSGAAGSTPSPSTAEANDETTK